MSVRTRDISEMVKHPLGQVSGILFVRKEHLAAAVRTGVIADESVVEREDRHLPATKRARACLKMAGVRFLFGFVCFVHNTFLHS